jgi:hypothetical protein
MTHISEMKLFYHCAPTFTSTVPAYVSLWVVSAASHVVREMKTNVVESIVRLSEKHGHLIFRISRN